MNIVSIDYSIGQKSLDIFISGCNGEHCEGCHNPELWDFSVGEDYSRATLNKIKKYVKDYDSLIDNILIMGGEPLDQDVYALRHLLRECSFLGKKVWLFTRYDLDKVPSNISIYCNYIKCGRFIPSLKTDNNIQYGIKLATSNQKIYAKHIDF